jgi:hypothetical protein
MRKNKKIYGPVHHKSIHLFNIKGLKAFMKFSAIFHERVAPLKTT